MEVIASCSDMLDESSKYQLISRYENRYYIRFELDDGFICELPVSEIPTGIDVVSVIRENPQEMVRIVSTFRKKANWTEHSYLQSTIVDCLLYSGDMPTKQASRIWKRLSRHEDIIQEMYNMIVEGRPGFRVVRSAGYTASQIMSGTQMNLIGVYLYMVRLREEPDEALPALEGMMVNEDTRNYAEE